MILRDKLMVNSIVNNIMNNKYKIYFDFTYKTQKHKIDDIIKKIIIVVKYGLPWRAIDIIPWQTV